MTLAERVFHELKILPEPYQEQVLDFVEFLHSKARQHSDLPEISETMLASEAVLRRDWDSPEEDAAWSDLYAIPLDADGFRDGKLRVASHIRPNRLFTADSSIVLYKAGSVTEEKLREVTTKIIEILRD